MGTSRGSAAPLQGGAPFVPWRTVDLEHALEQNVFTLQAPPPLLHGALRQTLREGLELTRDGQDATAVALRRVGFLLRTFFSDLLARSLC